MYAVRIQANVPPHLREAYLARWQKLTDYAEKQPGYQPHRLLNSLGYPSKYTAMRYYDSREASQAVVFSPAYRDLITSSPVEGITPIGMPEAFDVVLDIGKDVNAADVTEVVQAELTSGAGIGNAEFEKVRNDLFRLLQKHEPKLVRSRLLRFLGGGGRYVAIHIFTGPTDIVALQVIPEVAAFYQSNPNTKYLSAGPVSESYAPVRVLVPA